MVPIVPMELDAAAVPAAQAAAATLVNITVRGVVHPCMECGACILVTT